MAGGELQKTLAYLRRVADAGEAGALSDAELLERFVRSRDEAAFEVLLWRHGPLVLGVCKRILSHEQDAEDAFQAAFLALAKKAHTVASHASVASWLYKVALRVALKVRTRAARRPAPEPLVEPPAAPSGDDVLWRDLRPVLDEEVGRLPEKYRAPVLLCYLQGLTREEAARQLDRPLGTLSVRLLRARERLRVRLTRRGLAPSAGLLAVGLAERASAAVGGPMVSSTVKAALAFAAGAGGAAVSPAAAALAQGALRAMQLTRMRDLTVALAAGLLAVLAGALAFALETDPPAPPAPPQQAAGPAPKPGVKAVPLPKAAPADVTAAVKGNTHFAPDLYDRLRKPRKNLFFSPYSLSSALAMTYAGARGETADQMGKVLHFSLGQEKLHPAMADLAAQLRAEGKNPPYRLQIANALWGQKGHAFLPAFLDLNRAAYGAGMREADFQDDPEQARKVINAWAEKQTEGKIKDLIPPQVVNKATRLVLTNAVNFKAAWERPFNKKLTRKVQFRLGTPELVLVQVQMMSQSGLFRYFGDDELQAVELPYKGGRLSMVVLLPKKVDGLDKLEKQLTPANLERRLGGMKQRAASVGLPRLEVTSAFRLKKELPEMGMPLAFAAGMADFSGIDGEKNLFIQDVVHKAFVKVTEAGTEAGAGSAVVGGFGGPPPAVVHADHPFMFLIRDNRSGAILFLGRLVDPRLG